MIDPQAEAVRAAYNAGPPLNELGVEQARRWLLESRARRKVTTEVGMVENVSAGRLTVRIYHPGRGKTVPVIVFAHGGGWVLGSIETSDEACRRLTNAAGCAVASVEYRLAPEARHPAPIEDMLEVLRWIPAVAARYGLDADRIGIGGESSGAHVAICTALAAPNALAFPLSGQLLVCPAVDRRLATRSWKEFGDEYVPRRPQMAWMWDLYLGESSEFASSSLDPVSADLTGLPATVMVLAEYDPLRDEGLDLAHRIEESGVSVDVFDCAGQIHPVFTHAAAVEACDVHLRRAGRAMGELLARDRPEV